MTLNEQISTRVDQFKEILKSDIEAHGITECSIVISFGYNDKEKGITSEIKYSSEYKGVTG